MSRFLISCGGTGGHLSPGIAAAEGLAARGHGTRLLISRKQVDARLSEKYPQLQFERMPGTGFGWAPWRCAAFLFHQARAVWFCLRLMRSWKPDGILGFGGFTSAPVVVAGWLTGVPVALHESNRVPGRAIRMLGRLAQRVYLPPGITLPAVPPAHTRHVGLPVRSDVVRLPQAAARTALGLDPDRRLLVVLGGSQGSSALNDWVRRHFEFLAAEGIQVYCVTGLGKGRDGVVDLLTHEGQPIRVHFATFTDRVGELLSAADLVVSRAGAGTLAELIRCEAPAILVPYPHAADDHQRANAAYFERQGGGLAIEESQLGELRDRVVEVMGNDWLLRRFRANLQRMDRANVLELMLDDLEEIAREGAAGERHPRPQTA